MSWICGCRGGRPEDRQLLGQAFVAAHPQGSQLRSEGEVLLAFAPLSSDTQSFPHSARAGAATLVADARLERGGDWDSLAVGLAGGDFGCLAELQGDFALAVWLDSSRELHLARDCFGIRPLFYFIDDELLVFASDVRDVLAHPAVPQDYDLAALTHYLTTTREDDPASTFFSAVRRLPPAHHLVHRRGEWRVARYWQLQVQALSSRRLEDCLEQCRTLLEEAVVACLPEGLAAGVHLSGGLDSSTLAVLAARQCRRLQVPLTAFSWSPPLYGPLEAEDERRRIRQVCAQEELDCHYSLRYSHEMRRYLMRDPAREPIEMAFVEEPIQQEAQNRGIRVMLSGWGGDEFVSFNGRGVLAREFLSMRWWRVLQECAEIARRRRGTTGRTFLSKVASPILPDWVYHRYFAVPSATDYLHPALEAYRRPHPEPRELIGGRANMRALVEMGHLARRCESWALSGAGRDLEYRYPLLNRPLVEFCYSLPEEFHQARGYSRYFFRRVVEPWLPASLVWGFPKDERSAWSMTVAPRLDPDPGVLLRGLRAKESSPCVDLERLLQDWDRPECRSPLRSRAIQAAHLF